MNLPASLPSTTVLDTSGTSVHLSTLWAEQTRILVFLRHFG